MPNSDEGSTFTPGPMVEDTATRSMKEPLAPVGFDFCTANADNTVGPVFVTESP